MNDPRNVEITVDSATQLTQLLATYGIYTLVILFMFYMLYRERKNLEQAAQEDKQYHRRNYALVLGVTIGLSFLASGVWFYGTFLYKPKIVIEGTLKNMKEQAVMPVQLGDPPMVSYRLDAFRGDVQFYSSRQASLSGSSYDLDWVLISPRGLNTVQLIFQQEFCTLEADDQALQIMNLDQQQPLVPKPQRDAPIKTASIDFRAHEALRHEQIHLVYQPGPDVKQIGTLFIVQDDVRTEIPWDEDRPIARGADAGPQSASLDLGLTGVAWAQSDEPRPIFGPRGEISPQMVERLKLYLESEDLEQQLVAEDALVKGGALTFSTLKTVVQQKSPDHHGRNRLLHNVASAFQKIEASEKRTDLELSRVLAQALFEIGDYKLAAKFFLRVPHSSELPAQVGHQRAISYMNAGRYDDAERVFKSLLDSVEDPRQKSTVLTNLGSLYSRKGDPAMAKDSYEAAISLYPRNVTAISNLGSIELGLGNLEAAEELLERGREIDENNPHVLNNLAYVYAVQGKELDKALSFVDQALASNGENPQFLDTKGWVLYRRGQPQQALEYLEKALHKAPDDKEKKAHIEEVRRVLRSASYKVPATP